MRKPIPDIRGKSKRDVLNEAYFDKTDIRKGIKIPPMGMAIFMIPSTVPAISLYITPPRVIRRGRRADMVMPVKNISP